MTSRINEKNFPCFFHDKKCHKTLDFFSTELKKGTSFMYNSLAAKNFKSATGDIQAIFEWKKQSIEET